MGEVQPSNVTVRAHRYSDGTIADVTSLARFLYPTSICTNSRPNLKPQPGSECRQTDSAMVAKGLQSLARLPERQ